MISFPNAKINLGLHITAKRKDGYHDLESCFYPINWTDGLEITVADHFSFQSFGLPIPGNPDENLCCKIYHRLKQDFQLPEVNLSLVKNIPIGAGMGGGSSDCAFTIKLLNSLFDLGLSEDAMEDYVRPLGSDCAFFIRNRPVLATGKGDQFENVSLSLKGKHIVVVYPNINISTKEAYSGVVPQQSLRDLRELLEGDQSLWKKYLRNDFEDSLFGKYPQLPGLKNQLYDLGAFYASMTGSGSAVYGIFNEEPAGLEFNEYKVYKGALG